MFQLGYTSLFGWYASYLYLRTGTSSQCQCETDVPGSVVPSMAAHIFCNYMGLPDIAGAIERNPKRKLCMSLATLSSILTMKRSPLPISRESLALCMASRGSNEQTIRTLRASRPGRSPRSVLYTHTPPAFNLYAHMLAIMSLARSASPPIASPQHATRFQFTAPGGGIMQPPRGDISSCIVHQCIPLNPESRLDDSAGVRGNTGPEVGALLGDAGRQSQHSAKSFESFKENTHGPLMAEPFISPLALTMTPALSSK